MILHPENIKKAKTTILGIIFIILGLGGFIDCWIEFTSPCEVQSKIYVAAFLIAGLGFLFLDYSEIKGYIKQLIEKALNWKK